MPFKILIGIIVAVIIVAALLVPKGTIMDSLRKLMKTLFASAPSATNPQTSSDEVKLPLGKEELTNRIMQLEKRVLDFDQRIINAFTRINDCVNEISKISQKLKEEYALKSDVEFRINDLYSKLEKLRCDLAPYNQKCDIGKPIPNVTTQLYPIVRFSSVPENEMGFNESDFSESDGNGMIYRISIVSETRATYQIVSDSVKRKELLEIMNGAVKPYCDVQQDSSSISEIQDVEDGKLQLENGLWKICQKAKIKLI